MAFVQKISFDVFETSDLSVDYAKNLEDKITVEEVIKGLINLVEDNAKKDLPVARVLFPEEDEDTDIEITEEEWIDTREDTLRRCEVCSQCEWTMWERIRTGEGDPVDTLREHEGRLVCGCCEEMLGQPFSEYKRCCNCFLSEKMGRRYGISMIDCGGCPEDHICSVCNDIYPEIAGGENWLQAEEEGEWEQLLDGTWIMNGREIETYEGEFENEDLPENNTEIAKEIKGSISEIGEKLFDIQEKLTEGEYLKLMDLLQKVTNSVNRL